MTGERIEEGLVLIEYEDRIVLRLATDADRILGKGYLTMDRENDGPVPRMTFGSPEFKKPYRALPSLIEKDNSGLEYTL
jgi:hypothetical protein